MISKNIFIISAQPIFAERLSRFFKSNNYFVDLASTLDDSIAKLASNNFDLIFCETPILTNNDQFAILQAIKQSCPFTDVVFITDKIELKTAIDLVKAGAYTCVNRPVHPEELMAIAEGYFTSQQKTKSNPPSIPSETEEQIKNQRAIHKPNTPNYVESISAASRVLYKNIDLLSDTSLNVIVYGETGTGKEFVARRLAGKKGNYSSNFIAIDCGCLSKELAASELFGHVKGAFTGALQSRAGAFELANNGTIFLDEIGNLDYQVQTYLLRAIQERKIRRIGGEKEIEVNVRIIVACNEPLIDLVKKGQFREDLYHRLNEFEIVIPPLRARKDDIPLFIDFFLKKSTDEFGKNISSFSKDAIAIMQSYPWPGNIRELKNVVRKIVLLHDNNKPVIEVEELPDNILFYDHEASTMSTFSENIQLTDSALQASNLKEHTLNAELAEIIKVLRSVNFNKTKAAEILQINRKTLYNKLKLIEKYGLMNQGLIR